MTNTSNAILSELDPIARLTRDLASASATLGRNEARFLVDSYYTIQENRKASANQVRSLSTNDEPHAVIQWLLTQNEGLEGQIKRALDKWTDQQPIGKWVKSIVGIGPVIAAGLIAHIDITKAPTAGHIWSFAGLNPTKTWNKGEKRPWNNGLKTLAYKIGESFVKFQNHPYDTYGRMYVVRKGEEWARNLSGELSDQAKEKLEKFRIGEDTAARVWYSGCLSRESAERIIYSPAADQIALTKKLAEPAGTHPGMLPPAHIHSRARRHVVKLFLSHFHYAAYLLHFGSAPAQPYAIAQAGHAHFIEPPNLNVLLGVEKNAVDNGDKRA
jgi:hypothetical protein